MTVIKEYNTGTAQWETIVVGKQGPAGPAGVVQQTTAPSDTTLLWIDTDDSSSGPVIPPGGTTGEVLVKQSGTDYDTGWGQATPPVGSGLGTSGTVNLDMASLAGSYQTVALSGGITFTTSNRAAGRSVTLRLSAGGSSRSLAFPSWVFVGSAAPASLASGKVGVLSVTFFDTTDAGAVAAWAAQP